MKLFNDLVTALWLEKPVTLIIRNKAGKDCDAFYLPKYSDRTGKLIGHKITIYTKKTSRSFETLLAHELIHAWQEENNKLETHGEHFAELARAIEAEFNLQEVYLPDVDEE